MKGNFLVQVVAFENEEVLSDRNKIATLTEVEQGMIEICFDHDDKKIFFKFLLHDLVRCVMEREE